MQTAASQRPRKKTASRSTLDTEQCTHIFEIAGYNLHKGLAAGGFVRSAIFSVGGHDWCINYYPNGNTAEEHENYVSVYLELVSKLQQGTKVSVLFDFRLVDPATGLSSSVCSDTRVFDALDLAPWGFTKFMTWGELEASPFLRDDRLLIECDVTVIMGKPVPQSEAICDIQVPPSDLSDNLRNFLEAGEGVDVTFKVKGEVFHAHKIVLAMRSPVFKVELYGQMRDKRRRNITVEDMEPAVFKALLDFIYTDSLPAMDDLDGDESKEMVKHLLVAADRYGMERMKVMCESILGKRLDVQSVANTLVLADQHHCSQLKDACIAFINSSNSISDLVASQGYAHLKRACPAVIVEIWEKSAKYHKI